MKNLLLVMTIGLSGIAPVHASIIINEIMQNPDAVSDFDGEWFELFNSGSMAVDIDGWTIRDNDLDSHVIDNGGSLSIGPGGFLVLGNNVNNTTNGGVAVDYAYDRAELAIANGGDELILLDAMSMVVDRVEYDGGPAFPDPTGASMALVDASLDNNVGSNWATSTAAFGDGDLGTPGACNSDVGQQCRATVPEPASLLLLGLGLAGLGYARRRLH